MTISTKEGTLVRGQRVYQYVDQAGNIFWSFEKFPSVVTHSRTLTLEDRVGTHFDNYLSELRATRKYILDKEKDEDLGRG